MRGPCSIAFRCRKRWIKRSREETAIVLDLVKLAKQMQGMGQQLTQESQAARQRLAAAQELLAQVQAEQDTWVAQLHQWRDRLEFVAAEPIEPLGTRQAIAPAPDAHSLIATDGSQIAPSHHEIAYCYLLNTGRVALHYGQQRYPLLDSLPEIFYKPEDLYISRQWGITTEDWMGHRRTVAEAEALADLGTDLAHSIATGNRKDAPPTLAMVDGSLIYWFLDRMPGPAVERILPPILAAWERLRLAGIPLVSYLSAPRSGEAANFLRLKTCTQLTPDCKTHCPGQADAAPCNRLKPLRDAVLWSALLAAGERGPLWRSNARILDDYGRHRVYFCYLHVGPEVARVEMPEWVARDPAQLDRALSLVLSQVQKGYGYPIALAEAHNQAVVRGSDRARFFSLLEREMVKAGLRHIGTSYKEARKRNSIA